MASSALISSPARAKLQVADLPRGSLSQASCRASLRGPGFSSRRNAPSLKKEISLNRVGKETMAAPFFSSSSSSERRVVAMATEGQTGEKEVVFFDGGPHYGDLLVNLVFGLTFVWLPLTLAAVLRNLNFRYRFTDKRFTIISGLSTSSERRDYAYSAITDVKYIPRFIGEWGDLAITLSDKTIVELKSVPKFREIANYCLEKSGQSTTTPEVVTATTGSSKPRGFS